MKCKFELNELMGIGFTLVILGIGLALGLEVMSDVKDDVATCPSGYVTYNKTSQLCTNGTVQVDQIGAEGNATINAIDGVAKIPEKLPTIATVVVAAVIIGILVTYLWARFR